MAPPPNGPPPDDESELESTRAETDQAQPHFGNCTRNLGASFNAKLAAVEMLRAMVRCTTPEEALIAALDDTGFPVAQIRISRPQDLPAAVVLGRHTRCGMVLSGDPGVSLRHVLLILQPGRGPLRLRCVDLGGRSGVMIGDGMASPTCSARGHMVLQIGQTRVFILPGGPTGQTLLEGPAPQIMNQLVNNPTVDRQSGLTPESQRSRTRDLGGYRVGAQLHEVHRGVLRLRSNQDERGRVPHRDLDLRPEALRHGLLIGRYGDRCSLAGEGRNLSRVHALVCREDDDALLVFDLASTNGVRPKDQAQGPSHDVVRITPTRGCLLGQFHLDWLSRTRAKPTR